jgi:hypothetical protein
MISDTQAGDLLACIASNQTPPALPDSFEFEISDYNATAISQFSLMELQKGMQWFTRNMVARGYEVVTWYDAKAMAQKYRCVRR